MKPLGLISTTALFLLLGTTVPAFAQDAHDQDAKPAQHEEQAKPEKQEKQAKPAKQEEQAKSEKQQEAQPARQEQQQAKGQQEQQKQQQQQAKSTKQEQQQQVKGQQGQQKQQQQQARSEKPAKPEKQEQQTKQAKQEERSNAAGQQHVQRSAAEEQKQRSEPALRLSARSESRIPDDRFRSSFGSEHRFRIGAPRLVGGYSRFQYGGFWFGFVDPWPEGWYYTDDVYVDYIGGSYYLCNPSYPDARIAITVVL